MEDLLVSRGHGYGKKPEQRRQGNPRMTDLAGFQEDGSNYTQRNSRQKLVGDTKQRPQTVNPSQRVDHSLIEEISPGSHHQGAGKDYARIPACTSQWSPNVTQEVLEQETTHPR